MFKDVRNPINKTHASGCLQSDRPEIVIQDVYSRSMAKALYFRLCSRALINIEDIARTRVDKLKISKENTRDLDESIYRLLNAQVRIARGFGTSSDIIDIEFGHNASSRDKKFKGWFQTYWKTGHDSQYFEAADKGYQDRTWRARSWKYPSEDGDMSASDAVLQ